MLATVSRTLRTPLGARARKRGGFMQLRWFHIRGVCIAPGCVYRSSSVKRGMGIPGDHVKRVETYQEGGCHAWWVFSRRSDVANFGVASRDLGHRREVHFFTHCNTFIELILPTYCGTS
jgi:hypothetical protein